LGPSFAISSDENIDSLSLFWVVRCRKATSSEEGSGRREGSAIAGAKGQWLSTNRLRCCGRRQRRSTESQLFPGRGDEVGRVTSPTGLRRFCRILLPLPPFSYTPRSTLHSMHVIIYLKKKRMKNIYAFPVRSSAPRNPTNEIHFVVVEGRKTNRGGRKKQVS